MKNNEREELQNRTRLKVFPVNLKSRKNRKPRLQQFMSHAEQHSLLPLSSSQEHTQDAKLNESAPRATRHDIHCWFRV